MSTGRPDPAAGRGALRWLARSWWVLPSLVGGLFTWLSFYIVGVRAGRRDWIFAGAGYSATSALLFFALGREEVDAHAAASALTGAGLLVAWIGGAVHALIVNQIYQRLPEPVSQPGRPASPRPASTGSGRGPSPAAPRDDAGLGLGAPIAEYLAPTGPERPDESRAERESAPHATGSPVQANTARARALARLPGIDEDLAARWVAERERRGGFRDLDDLANALNLQPHQMVRLRPRLAFSEPAPGKPRRPTRRARRLDV